MAATGRVPALIQRYFDCVNGEDWTGLGAIWHEHGSLRATGARPREGREDVVGYYPRIFSFWAEHLDEPTRILVDGDTVVAEVHFSGSTVEGRRVEFDAVDIFDLEGGLIRRLSNWYDVAYAREQLAAPASE